MRSDALARESSEGALQCMRELTNSPGVVNGGTGVQTDLSKHVNIDRKERKEGTNPCFQQAGVDGFARRYGSHVVL